MNGGQKRKLVNFILYSVFLFFESTALEEDILEEMHGKIIHSSVLFRHGDRAVTTEYPADPNPTSVWPQGLGQLTQEGKRQGYELGKWLRGRYENNIINSGYMAETVLVNSSDKDRCLMTAEVVLAGLFPPNEREMWNDDHLKWQPIPVHSVPAYYDYVLHQTDVPCERYTLEIYSTFNTSGVRALYQKYKNVIQYAKNYSGFDMPSEDLYQTFSNIWSLYTCLFVEDLHNLTIPYWATKIYPEPLQSLAVEVPILFSFTPEMKKIKGGPLLGSIINDMQNKRDEQFNQSLHLYSAHDFTISYFLSALNVYNKIIPSYCSSVIVELRQKEDSYIVTILYRNSTTEPPYLLKVPGCDNICTLDQFINVTKDLIPKDIIKECQIGFLERLFLGQYNTFVIPSIVSLLIIFLGVVIVWYRRKKPLFDGYHVIDTDG